MLLFAQLYILCLRISFPPRLPFATGLLFPPLADAVAVNVGIKCRCKEILKFLKSQKDPKSPKHPKDDPV